MIEAVANSMTEEEVKGSHNSVAENSFKNKSHLTK